MWQCPECSREFRRKTRHSCAHYEVSEHLAKMSITQEDTWEQLCSELKLLPDLVYDAVKSGIELRVEGALFAIVKPTKGILRLSLIHEKPILNPRIHKTYQSSAKRCYNVTDVASPDDIDQQLIGWLIHAHALFSGIEDADRA